MFIGKEDIEDFDKCAVGDILFQDPKDKKFEYKLYNRHNRTVMKLKSRPVMPSAIVSKIEENGLQIQSISVYDESTWTATSSIPNYTYPGNPLTTITGGTTTNYTPSTDNTWWSLRTGKIKP